jgi:hypothetical protein
LLAEAAWLAQEAVALEHAADGWDEAWQAMADGVIGPGTAAAEVPPADWSQILQHMSTAAKHLERL